MRPNIARWLWNTIALPEYAGHLNPANNGEMDERHNISRH
jgi:hypothetical protein